MFGVGLRPTHYPYLEEKPKIEVDWFEGISDNFMNTEGRPMTMLELVRADYPVALHGVGLSIAEDGMINPVYLQRLKTLVDRIEPILVSDHLCWTRGGKHHLHDLLPVPYTTSAIDIIVERLERVQEYLGRQIIMENVSSYIGFAESEMHEWEFISEIIQRSGCGLLLDVNNVVVNARNHRFLPQHFIDGIPIDAVKQIHLAGHEDLGEILFDTHGAPVSKGVWDLWEYTSEKLMQNIFDTEPCHLKAKQKTIPVIVEWDQNIPDFETLQNEVILAKRIWERTYEDRTISPIAKTVYTGDSFGETQHGFT
ncbi:MAG: hypothetical protein CMP10_19460 [Zetaproteobacteria bacterium]|nr:hypothetical protein [Pseudobdellovibrionaceae bacterium]